MKITNFQNNFENYNLKKKIDNYELHFMVNNLIRWPRVDRNSITYFVTGSYLNFLRSFGTNIFLIKYRTLYNILKLLCRSRSPSQSLSYLPSTLQLVLILHAFSHYDEYENELLLRSLRANLRGKLGKCYKSKKLCCR